MKNNNLCLIPFSCAATVKRTTPFSRKRGLGFGRVLLALTVGGLSINTLPQIKCGKEYLPFFPGFLCYYFLVDALRLIVTSETSTVLFCGLSIFT
jgi:hypothetical protein